MYLTRIEMELSDHAIRSGIQDRQRLHKLITGLFQSDRKGAEILFRCRNRGMNTDVYIYSSVPVEKERILPSMHIIAQRDLTEWLLTLKNGSIYGFQLITLPFKKVSESGRKNSRRRALKNARERLEWLERKAEQNGFTILSVNETPSEEVKAWHPDEKGGRLTMNTYCYTGLLKISDAEAFQKAIRTGIGPGKAYGLGMLILARG